MLYKIKFKDNFSFSDIFSKLQSIGDFCFSGQDIFVNTDKNIEDLEYVDEYIKINSINYKHLSSGSLKKWCQDILMKIEIEEYEKSPECQEKLKGIDDALKVLEGEVFGIGGEKNNNDN